MLPAVLVVALIDRFVLWEWDVLCLESTPMVFPASWGPPRTWDVLTAATSGLLPYGVAIIGVWPLLAARFARIEASRLSVFVTATLLLFVMMLAVSLVRVGLEPFGLAANVLAIFWIQDGEPWPLFECLRLHSADILVRSLALSWPRLLIPGLRPPLLFGSGPEDTAS